MHLWPKQPLKLAIQFFSPLFLLTSCSEAKNDHRYQWQKIAARNEEKSLNRPLVYQALLAKQWKKIPIPFDQSIYDSKLAVCQFLIEETKPELSLFLHTFPFNKGQMRPSPQAQIERWKRQFEAATSLEMEVTPFSCNGFCGLKLIAEGKMKGKPVQMIAYAMQLAEEHRREIELSLSPLDRYKLADYTIKIVGPLLDLQRHKEDIEKFAQSFEFIDELTTTL